MDPPRQCPQCGAELASDAPAGLCPACLMKAGLGGPTHADTGTDLPTVSGPSADDARGPQRTPPRIEGYEVLGPLGEGGMGIVWRAVQLSTRRPVALKLLLAGGFASPKARLRFEREVELAARLEHPHIARVYESGLHQGAYYYAMELVEGVHLDQYVADHALS